MGISSTKAADTTGAYSFLLSKIAQRNKHAHDELCTQIRPLLMRQARRIFSSHSASEDLFQETMLAIWQGARSYCPEKATPLTWMTSVLRHKAFDQLRATQHLARWGMNCPDGSTTWHTSSPIPEHMLEQAQENLILTGRIAKLKPSYRMAVELVYFRDLTLTEVAEELNVPVGTAKTWLRRGCIELRKHYGV